MDLLLHAYGDLPDVPQPQPTMASAETTRRDDPPPSAKKRQRIASERDDMATFVERADDQDAVSGAIDEDHASDVDNEDDQWSGEWEHVVSSRVDVVRAEGDADECDDWGELVEDDGLGDCKQQLKTSILDAFSKSSPFAPPFVPHEVGNVVCLACANWSATKADITAEEPICLFANHRVCKTNNAIMKWAATDAYDIVSTFDLDDIQAVASTLHPEVNVAAWLLEQRKYLHLQSLLRAAPKLLTPLLLFLAVSRADFTALCLLSVLYQDKQSFYRWAFTLHLVSKPFTRTKSVLHVAVAAGHVDFAIEHLVQPLHAAVGDIEFNNIMSNHLSMPSTHLSLPASNIIAGWSPVQFGVKYFSHQQSLLRLMARIDFGMYDRSIFPVVEAASNIATLSALRQLVNYGVNLDPIWPMIRADSRLSWLLSLLLDTFFEQGLRCGARNCFVRKLACPDVQKLIVSFLWSGMRRPSVKSMRRIRQRKGCCDD